MVLEPSMKEPLLECMTKQLLERMEKVRETQSLAVDQMKSIKKIQVICKSLCLARYEQETPTKEGGGQCAPKERNLALYEQEKLIKESDRQGKLEDKKAIGAPQNQIIPPSHNSSMQQLLNRVMVLQQQKAYHLCGCSIITSFKPKK